MSATPGRPLPLPFSALPDDCPSWNGEQAHRWLDALPARWVPLPSRHQAVALVATVAVTGLLVLPGGWRPWAAALLVQHGLWLYTRPEIVPVSAPVLAVVLLGVRPGLTGPETVVALAALALAWTLAVLRLAARAGQRERGREAAAGMTAPLPDADRPVHRGRFLLASGGVLLTVGLGAATLVTAHPPDSAENARALPALAWLLAAQGLTASVSGLLGHRRATALRAAPAPVLRVLVREGADTGTEVFAADDTGGLRPLFTVAVTEVGSGDEGKGEGEEGSDEEALEEFLRRIDREGPGPLREAVLYGVPCDGAEILLVTGAGDSGGRPVLERSAGPVRPLSDQVVRRLLSGDRRRADRRAAYEERHRAAGEAVARETVVAPAAVRQWRAGPLDRISGLLLALWGCGLAWGDTGWRGTVGAVLGFAGALLLPHWLAWRVTADSEGLWVDGLRGPRLIPWDELRTVRCAGTELKLDGRRASFAPWSVHAPRWPWLERRFGLLHPYERAGAEITALWRNPALRPPEPAEERRRGRPLWPLALILATAWTAALLLLR